MADRFTPQAAPDMQRIIREARPQHDEHRRRLDAVVTRLDDLEAFEAYVRDELVPYIDDLRNFVVYGPPPPTPPE